MTVNTILAFIKGLLPLATQPGFILVVLLVLLCIGLITGRGRINIGLDLTGASRTRPRPPTSVPV